MPRYLLAQEFKRIACRPEWLRVNGFPERWIIISSGCLLAEKSRWGKVIVELRAGAKGPFMPSKCVDVLADDVERNLQDD